jgi:predicted ABC-type ATPase
MSESNNQLNKEELQRVLREKVIAKSRLDELTSHETPKAIVLAGQPGSGKGGLVRAAELEFGDDILIIDPDRLRDRLPYVRALQESDPFGWPKATNADAFKLANGLRDEGIKRHVNLVIDGSMSDAGNSIRTIQNLQKKGYEVEIRVMSAHWLESELGIDERFTRQVDEQAVARDVAMDFHNGVYRNLPGNVNAVSQATGVSLQIYDRELNVLYDSRRDLTPASVVLNETRAGRLEDPELQEQLREGWSRQRDWHHAMPDILHARADLPSTVVDALVAGHTERGMLERASARIDTFSAIDAPERMKGLELPHLGRASIAAVGGLATAYDGAVTARDAWDLHQQGNATGVESEVMGFGVRNAGAWAGAIAGAKAGTLLGIESGPGMLLTGIAGAGIGAWGSERVVDWIEQHQIHTQTDRNGMRWQFDPRNAEQGWQREVVEAFAERGLSRTRTETAPAEIADELNYKASTRAVELRLAALDVAANPFEVAADASDRPSVSNSPWVRNPETRQWQREVDEGVLDRKRHTVIEPATTEKAAELDAYAQSVIAYNAARSPAAMAAYYQDVYEHNGWQRHGDGELPSAVRNAREDVDTLMASDGDRYRRQTDGRWVSNGVLYDSIAQGNLRDELEATRSVVQARVSLPSPSLSNPQSAIGMQPHALDSPSEHTRDVREQPQREGGRAGLLQDDAKDAARSAAPSMPVPGGRNGQTDSREHDELEAASPKRAIHGAATDPTVSTSVPPDFAPSQQGLRDLRDPRHEGHEAFREMRHRAGGFETQNGIPHGLHTERLGASLLAFAVEKEFRYQNVFLEKHQDTGQVMLKHARYGEPTQYFPADLAGMSSQPIEATSQRINEAVSKHNANPAPTLERTQTQAQALGAYTFEDQVLFARIRGGTPGHISDEYVGVAVLEAKKHGIDANNIAQVSMVGEHIRMARSGPDEKTVLVDVNAPAPSLQASIAAANTFNQEQALAKQQALLQQQTQNPQFDGPSGPTIGSRTM